MIPQAYVFRLSWHPASDAKPDRMRIKPLFDLHEPTMIGKARVKSMTIDTVSDTIDERLACHVIGEKGYTPVSKFEYEGFLFIVCNKTPL